MLHYHITAIKHPQHSLQQNLSTIIKSEVSINVYLTSTSFPAASNNRVLSYYSMSDALIFHGGILMWLQNTYHEKMKLL